MILNTNLVQVFLEILRINKLAHNISMLPIEFIKNIYNLIITYPHLKLLCTFYNRLMDEEDLYDEFGNYIGPQIVSESEEDGQIEEKKEEVPVGVEKVLQVSNQHRIVLHEDKKFYQSHQEMYPEAEIMIEQEDRQTLETPLVSTEAEKRYDYEQPLQTYYEKQYLLDLMGNNALIRNVCVAGHLHHGKTLLLDMFIQDTHLRKPTWNLEKNYRWLDSRIDEQQKQLSIKAAPITLLLQDLRDKHYVFNFIDTPGHPNFLGEVSAGLRVCQGVVLVIDAIEGVMLMTEKVVKHIIRQKLPVVVVINKIDRLIVEMKIPPEDAYLKIKHTLEEINGLFLKYSQQLGMENNYVLSPLSGNVLFASAQYSFMFSLHSFALKYQQLFPSVDPSQFKQILWGDYYFNHQTRKFQRTPAADRKRTFVEYILQPIYKIFAHTVGKDRAELQTFLQRNLQIGLTPQEYRLNIKTMIKLIMRRYFGVAKCFAESLVAHFPPPNQRAAQLVQTYYRGAKGDFRSDVSKGDKTGPLLINIVKLFHNMDYKSFSAWGRVISGTIKKNDQLRIMGENYMAGDEEDLFVRSADKLYLLQGRYRLEVSEVTAGNMVLIGGIDQAITKTATLTHAENLPSGVDIMLPLKFWSQPTIKVAIQPLIPNELPKLIEAIRRVNKSYLLLRTKVEESGEHVLIGNGQMHLDCILHDIRLLYSDIECRISDPTVTFSQTVIETSGIPCHADTPNKKNRLKTLAGPLEKAIGETVEKELLEVNDQKQVQKFLESKYDWDILASTNVWAFGPEIYGTNILINDSLPSGTSQEALSKVRQSVVQGFRWSTREGPLCDEPMRNVKFRVIEAELAKNAADCAPGQMIPTARRAFYSSFLTANPRMMEPVYYTQIQCTTKQSIQAVFAVLSKRRGSVQNDVPKVGTPHYIIKAFIPCIQALGFQTDLRSHTVGQAFCLQTFDHWQTLPGDPLDKRIVLRPLEVLQPHEIAREFMIKTRRRKGLNEEVSIVKYFDDLNIKQLLKNDASFKDFI